MPNQIEGLRRARDAIIAYVEAGNQLIACQYADEAGRRCALGVLLYEAGVDLDPDSKVMGKSINAQKGFAGDNPDWCDVVKKWRRILRDEYELTKDLASDLQRENDSSAGKPTGLDEIPLANPERVVDWLNQKIHELEQEQKRD